MTTREIVSELKITQIFVPAVRTAATTSDVVDTAGYNSATLVAHMGNSGDTLSGSLYWTLTVTESDTSGGSYTAVAATDLVGLSGAASYVIDAPAEDSLDVKIGYIGSKRYVKLVATPTGSHSTGTPIGMSSILGGASNAPVA
jgi:hypothetical protein